MQIPLTDLSRLPPHLSTKIIRDIASITKSGTFILGTDVDAFEKSFARYTKTKYCVGLASGTDAILLSLLALGIKKDDEVIVPAMTFIASVAPLIHIGAKPVFVDILPDQPLINHSKIERVITKKTKAIMPVHVHGFPCDMEEIVQIAHSHSLTILEDACQAHGSTYKTKIAGSLGDIAAFSFYPSKNLGAFGDAGAITTNDASYASAIRRLRNHGQTSKYVHHTIGYNSRLDTLQATVLRTKLPTLSKNNSKRRALAKTYADKLAGLPLITPRDPKNTVGNYHVYAIRTKKRDALKSYLEKSGIQCGIHYPLPLHLQPALQFLGYHQGDFPHAEQFANETLSLPMFPELTEKEIDFIVKKIKRFFTASAKA